MNGDMLIGLFALVITGILTWFYFKSEFKRHDEKQKLEKKLQESYRMDQKILEDKLKNEEQLRLKMISIEKAAKNNKRYKGH